MLKKLGFISCCLFLILGLNSFAFSQESISIKQDLKVSSTTFLENIEIYGQGVKGVFSSLALSHEIPIGLELGVIGNDLNVYKIKIANGNLGYVLDQILKEVNRGQSQYIWEIRDGVVNIFPKESFRDYILKSILKTKIKKFSLKKNSSCRKMTETLVAVSEIKDFFHSNGMVLGGWRFSGFYLPMMGKDFTLRISDKTLKSILNKAINESPTARFWYVDRIGFNREEFYLGFYASQEDSLFRGSRSGMKFDNSLIPKGVYNGN